MTEQKYNELFDEYLEQDSKAPQSLQDAYDEMQAAFENYLAEYQTHEFKAVYEFARRKLKEEQEAKQA